MNTRKSNKNNSLLTTSPEPSNTEPPPPSGGVDEEEREETSKTIGNFEDRLGQASPSERAALEYEIKRLKKRLRLG